jgi:hypothetical protein
MAEKKKSHALLRCIPEADREPVGGYKLIPCDFLREDTKRLSGAALRVCLAIVSYSNIQGQAWPSIDTLCRCTRLKRRSVFDALKELESLGLLLRKGLHKTTTLYQLGGALQHTPHNLRDAPQCTPFRSEGCTTGHPEQ